MATEQPTLAQQVFNIMAGQLRSAVGIVRRLQQLLVDAVRTADEAEDLLLNEAVRATQLEFDLEAANERNIQLQAQLDATGTALEHEQRVSKQLNTQLSDAMAKRRDQMQDVARKVVRRDKHLEMAAAVAASTKVKLKVAAETRAFFETLMQEKPDAAHQNLRLLIENQLDTLLNKSGRCVWHVEVLDWCTDVYRRNPAAYEHMCKGGFLKLPHADTCRKRAACFPARSSTDYSLL